MKNIIERKNMRQYYNVGYAGDNKIKQVIDFIITTLLAAAMVAMVLLIIISHIVGGK